MQIKCLINHFLEESRKDYEMAEKENDYRKERY